VLFGASSRLRRTLLEFSHDHGPYEQIAVAVDRGILTLTLIPEKLNASPRRCARDDRRLRQGESDDAVGAVIVTGAGARSRGRRSFRRREHVRRHANPARRNATPARSRP